MSEVKESEYNGKPLIGLYRNAEDQLGFKFGVKKAQMVIEHINAIKAFVDRHDKVTALVG